MNSLYEHYKKTVVPKLREQLKIKNIHAVPRLSKVVLNVGAGKALSDSRFYEVIEDVLTRITGQRPQKTKAKTSISSFKIRQGMVVGFRDTLRGNRMYDFVEKLINITLPRVRDFRGLSLRSFDGKGNYSIGFREYIPFPEIRSDEIEKIHGIEVTIHTTAKSNEEGLALLSILGFPFEVKRPLAQ
jgi:large subunit ribosomal protein L5